ncbi:alpha/beta fold hydrolase [Mesorhizobium sp. M0184]|uniref:alpha/beta fold hydrolase n=1 Tax=Mesorhizobium sp. M0184 TaxID=2956906 RepID=UPI00333D5151
MDKTELHPGPTQIYAHSFSRNLGILTQDEQQRLADATVLIVGTGGIGSNSAALLARMGVGGFHLVDADTFELANINRQFGAKLSTIGQRKVDVVRDEILDINPSARVNIWAEKFTPAIAEAVFDGADICIDAIDFYCIADHLQLHEAARRLGRYVVMGSPVGFSGCLQVFAPEGMSLQDYCGIKNGMEPVEMQLRYACGLVPHLAHLSYYDVSKAGSNTDFLKGEGPSLASACGLASALVVGEIAMILLDRRKPRAIPYTLQYDPCTFRHEAVYLEGGMPNYDPTEILETIEDKSSLVVNVFDTLYRKAKAETVALPDGGYLCYRMAGEGPPLVFLSPVGGDTSFWARQTPVLAADFRAITIDNRGIGRSSNVPHDAESADMARDVIFLIEHLGLARVALAGCALGGLIAIQVAVLRPDLVSALSLASCYETADETILSTTADWRATAREAGMDDVFDQSLPWLFSETYRRDHEDELYKLRTFYRVNRQLPEEFCKQILIANRFEAAGPLSGITCPVQLVHGAHDRLVDPRHARALNGSIAGSELEILPEAGHFANWEESAAYNSLLAGFLARTA